MDPQTVKYPPKTTGNRVINRAEKILKSPLVRTLQWISKFCENKGVLLIFSTYGVFYSLIKNANFRKIMFFFKFKINSFDELMQWI